MPSQGYYKEFPIPNATTNTYIIECTADGVPPLNDILIKGNVAYAGGTFQLREIFIFDCEIVNESLVDVDFNWANPHYYLGTYQISGHNQAITTGTEDFGFINRTRMRIERYATIDVVANPDRKDTVGGIVSIEQCNLRLMPELGLAPPVITPVLTYVPEKTQPIMLGLMQCSPPAVEEAAYFSQIGTVAIKLRPGVQPINATYSIVPHRYVINDDPELLKPTCKLPDNPICDVEFDIYIRSINNGLPIDDPNGVAFSDNGTCVTASPIGQCYISQYTCTSGEVREFYGILVE